jgi:PAS domain S-box-containing protein
VVDKFSLLAGMASDWWWEMDAQLRFTFISDRFTELYGMPAACVLGRLRTDMPRADYDNQAWLAHLDDLANRRPFRDFLTTFIDAKGVTHPIKLSGTPLFAGDGVFQGYIGVGHDLTDLRRKEQEALREARKLDSVLQNIDQGVLVLDADLRVVAYNRAVVQWQQLEELGDVVGIPYEVILRRLVQRGELEPEDGETAIARRLALLRAGRRFESERTRKDGRVFTFAFNPLPEGGGVMTYTDVTAARQREAAVVRSEESLRYRFRNLPLPQWIYSARTLNFLDVNDAAIAEYGYTREEFLAMKAEDMCGPEGAARLRRWLDEGRPTRFELSEWENRRKDGSIIHVESYGRDIDFDGEPARIAIIIDVTARKEAERLNQRLFETTQDLVFVTDGYGRFVRVSPSVTRLLGWAPGEMIGRSGAEFAHPDDVEAMRSEITQSRRGRQIHNFRARYRHKNGHVVSFLWMGVWSETDRRHYFVGRDMTDLDATEAQLRQAQKMEAVGRLTGGVAHDFNNILMVILANIEALAEDERLPQDLHRRIAGIEKVTQRAADLTRQLLAFSRRQPLRPERIDVNELVAGTVGLMRRTLGETVEMETALDDGLWPVEADRGQLQAALVNICINGRDAMPGGGKLLVETRNVALDAGYAALNADATVGDHVMVAVTDTGTGMAPEILDRVFEPFFTTKEVGQGTGLGLSMVYGFVRQSNGHVKIYSEVGHGTSVRIYLPRHLGVQTAGAVARTAALPRGTESILLAEDDPRVRQSVAEQLRGLGYRVVEAADGAAALAALEAMPHPVDLLLTDVIMPGALQGRALADAVTRRWPQVRVVFMSGYTESAVSRQGRLDAGAPLLNKPFRRRELAQMLRLVLDGRGVSNTEASS